nr:MAG TPA: hypothetical protein [Caudoviricetes sp.]
MSGKVYGPAFGMEKPVPYISTQFTVKSTTFNYHKVDDKKVELREEVDLKAFLLNTIKKEVSVDKIVTQFLDKNASVYNMRKLDSIEFQEPEVELNHVWNENGVNTIEGLFTLNIKYLPDDEIRYQVQIPFTPIGEEEHISDYEIHTYYYEGKIQSICNALLQGAIKHLESF